MATFVSKEAAPRGWAIIQYLRAASFFEMAKIDPTAAYLDEASASVVSHLEVINSMPGMRLNSDMLSLIEDIESFKSDQDQYAVH